MFFYTREILDALLLRRDAMLADLRTLVEHESPSRDKTALDDLAQMLAARFEANGMEAQVITNPSGGDHVCARWGRDPAPGHDLSPVLILGHFDTVWPRGTLERLPFRIEGQCAYGPGVFDMKASLVMVETAISALKAMGVPTTKRPVDVLFTSDEEIGSPHSRPIIEAMAKASAHVLVIEPPLSGGALKTSRKGVGAFTLEVSGKAAHAGVEPEKGISAVTELAHQIIRVNALAHPAAGTTVNVGVIEGGTTANVVPARAVARVDVRASTVAEAQRLEEAFRSLEPISPGASLVVSGGFNRPPMERTPAIAALFGKAREIARGAFGLELTEGSTGGGSDGNFTAAVGTPTLDGLGALGGGAHADHEHILIDSLAERAALLALLILAL